MMKSAPLCAVLVAAWLVAATAPSALADPPAGVKPHGKQLKSPIPLGPPATERPIGEGPGGPEGPPGGPGGGTQPQQGGAAPGPAAPIAAPVVSALSGASIRVGCIKGKGKARRVVRCKRSGALKRALELRFNASASTTAQLKVTQKPRPKSKKTKRARARTIMTRNLQAAQGGNRFVLPLKRARAGYVVTVTLTLPGTENSVIRAKTVVRA